ncbi:MAG: M48 family metalloprotease [Candidatus Omnitrophica bacterium]|nr:M48 family metalloprotease [Candidatus Omnitrophota bacterium]
MRYKFWIKISWFGFLTFIIFSTGCVSVYNPVTGKKEWYLFDEKGEISWGDAMANEFIKENKLLDDQKRINYIKDIGVSLAKVSHRSNLNYKFYIIDQDQMNALAIPGGHVFIYKGLLDTVDDSELAFVLAHEIGHISARHSLKKLGATLGFSILATTLLRSPDQAQAKQLVNQLFGLVAKGYSRSDELQADNLAFNYVSDAGYDPRAAISLFEKLKEANKGMARPPFYLSSHPNSDQRIKNISSKLKELKGGGVQ